MDWIETQPALKPLVDEWFEQAYQSCQYVSPNNILEGILSSNEIMLHCDKVGVVPYQEHIHPDMIAIVEHVLNARFNLENNINTKQLINLMLPHIFK